jgi:hypothetical protein
MVEITHKGTWFKWDSLDARDKLWFLLSTVTSVPVGLLIGVMFVEWGHDLGYRVGAGEHGPRGYFADILASDAFRYAVLAALALAALSGFAWWRFSIRQDELFNRIQNGALGRAGAWSVAAAGAWWLLSLGGWVGPFPLGPFLLASMALLLVFWFHAVHKWAS